MKKFQTFRLMSLSLLIALSSAAAAQAPLVTPPVGDNSGGASPSDEKAVEFEADTLEYDNEADIVTASGNVQMAREGNEVRADKIVWQRTTGQVVASGNVKVTNPGGDIAYGDSIELTDTLRDGVVQNLLIVLANGGRLAARSGTRTNGIAVLRDAAYSPCDVVDSEGCPIKPTWQIFAKSLTYDPADTKIRFKGVQFDLFGLRLGTLPSFSIPTEGNGSSGLLVPDLRYSQSNGLELALPFHLRIAPNRDLTITPHVFTNALPALEAEYRALTSNGAYRIAGYGTYSSQLSPTLGGTASANRQFRGYFDANGRFQIDPKLSVKFSARVATDRTFLRRYDLSRDDRLRSIINLERVSQSSYFSLAGYGFQTLRANDVQGQVPFALPVIDYRKRFSDPLVGGRFELQLNSLAIARTSGQDTQRAFASARWDLRRYTSLGQEVQFTAFGRGDIYHTDETTRTSTTIYRGQEGWQSRAIAAAAVEVRWPFIGTFLGGTQRLTPRVQIVASPGTNNLKVPNEDSRAIELEDINLFSLNRFPGYDRFEDGTRIVYGADWALDRKNFSLNANVGQSYRLTSKATLFPDGTGLTNRTSDVVGRTTLKYKRFVALTHRYRLDKDNLAIRRNEVDMTVGNDSTYAVLGYLRLNRDVAPGIEDLRDREEARAGGRVQVSQFWSVFGSAIIDLTNRSDDPTSLSDGFDPVRTRLGIAYEDNCFKFGLTWRRDYDASGDARRGNSFQLELSFRNIGR